MMLSDEFMMSRTNERTFAGYEKDAELRRRVRERRDGTRGDARGTGRPRRDGGAEHRPVGAGGVTVGPAPSTGQRSVEAGAEPARELVDAGR